MIKIEDLKLIGQGTQKLVCEHPSDIEKVIKIMRPENATPDGGRATQNKLRSHRAQGIYRQFRRELLQYLQLCKNNYSQKLYTFPIETVYGFIATNKGLALVTEKIIAPSGSPLTLEHLVRNNSYKLPQQKALKRFFTDCRHYHVVFGEVNIGGIMYTESRHGRPEFVLVDGIGEKLFIPFRAMSKTINNRNIAKVEAKIKAELRQLDETLER